MVTGANMTSLAPAEDYIAIVYGGKPLDLLSSLLAENLYFDGPHFKYKSDEDYINALKNVTTGDFNNRLPQSYANISSVCRVNMFFKSGVEEG